MFQLSKSTTTLTDCTKHCLGGDSAMSKLFTSQHWYKSGRKSISKVHIYIHLLVTYFSTEFIRYK